MTVGSQMPELDWGGGGGAYKLGLSTNEISNVRLPRQ